MDLSPGTRNSPLKCLGDDIISTNIKPRYFRFLLDPQSPIIRLRASMSRFPKNISPTPSEKLGTSLLKSYPRAESPPDLVSQDSLDINALVK